MFLKFQLFISDLKPFFYLFLAVSTPFYKPFFKLAFAGGKDKDKLEEAKNITEQDILHELGRLPEAKLHCPKLAVTTLQKAVTTYENDQRKPLTTK